MPETTVRNYDVKAVPRSEAGDYQSFGWIKSKESVPADMTPKKSKQPYVLLKRKYEFGSNLALANNEKEYEKLKKKKYRQKPILGIIFFLLMLACLVLTGVELYFGISSGLEKVKADNDVPADSADNADKPSNASDENPPSDNDAKTGPLDQVKTILETIQKDYLSKITDIFDGKTNAETGEYTNGIADNIAASMQPPIKYFINANNIVAVIALVLAIIFIILFAEVCKIKKKRSAKFAKMNDLLVESEEIANEMRRRDLSLMGRTQRKQYMWTNIIANGIRQANGTDDDDDDY